VKKKATDQLLLLLLLFGVFLDYFWVYELVDGGLRGTLSSLPKRGQGENENRTRESSTERHTHDFCFWRVVLLLLSARMTINLESSKAHFNSSIEDVRPLSLLV